jgi:hypothetical protein
MPGKGQWLTFGKPVSQLGMAAATRDAERGEAIVLFENVEWSAGLHKDFGDFEIPAHAGEVERLTTIISDQTVRLCAHAQKPACDS